MNLKAILIVAGLVIGGAAIAQGGAKAGSGQQGGPGRPGQGGPGGPGGMRRMTPEQRVDRIGKELGLTAAQKTKVLAIYKASADQGKKIFEDKKMTREQKMAAFEKFRDANTKKIKAILTKDQIKKYEAMLARRRMGGPGGPGGRPGGPGAPGAGGKPGTGGKSGG